MKKSRFLFLFMATVIQIFFAVNAITIALKIKTTQHKKLSTGNYAMIHGMKMYYIMEGKGTHWYCFTVLSQTLKGILER